MYGLRQSLTGMLGVSLLSAILTAGCKLLCCFTCAWANTCGRYPLEIAYVKTHMI
jgi:hypothetical protein